MKKKGGGATLSGSKGSQQIFEVLQISDVDHRSSAADGATMGLVDQCDLTDAFPI